MPQKPLNDNRTRQSAAAEAEFVRRIANAQLQDLCEARIGETLPPVEVQEIELAGCRLKLVFDPTIPENEIHFGKVTLIKMS